MESPHYWMNKFYFSYFQEIINQEMKNLQNLCLTRRQKILESKNEREFEKETEELDTWINEQMSHATSEEFGEDYEHVLVRKRKL